MDPMLLLFGLAYVMGRRRDSTRPLANSLTPPPPKVFAYLYQLPEDGFTTTRMAFGEHGKAPEEMGIFQSPDAAQKLALEKGWILAWQGVKQLNARPGG